MAACVFSYARFSSKKQANGDSLRRQGELRDLWCARNNLTLDESLAMTDEATSAYRGKHRQSADRTALGAFVDQVRRGRVPEGSFLVVESLDRLSREDAIPALGLLIELIQAGVRVVQLLPVEQIYDRQSEPMQLMVAIMELSRGNSESKVKSERVSAAWSRKKAAARTVGTPLTRNCPAWLAVTKDGKYRLRPARAKVVKQIFQWAAAGLGVVTIVKRLTAGKVPVLAAAAEWTPSYVRLILRSPSAFGQYQPMRRDGDGRVPDGEPVENYYPAAVTEAEFYAARAAMTLRGGRRRGGASTHVNLWTGLLHDATDGTPLYVVQKRRNGRAWTVITRPPARTHRGGSPVFPAGPFEQAVLGRLEEIDPKDILARKRGVDRVLALTGELAAVEARREDIIARITASGPSETYDEIVRRLDARRAEIAAELPEAKGAAARSPAASWGEFRSLLDALRHAADPAEARQRLRSALRGIVSGIHCVIARVGLWRVCACQVWFKEDGQRTYVVLHHPEHSTPQRRWAARTHCRSVKEALPAAGDLDLRRPAHAKRLAAFLQTVQLPPG
jgi:DNA invertase Pin-like site-specific DNA recombinase